MSDTPLVVGSYLSPYVRKLLVCLHLKGIDYRIDPIVPFYGNDAFARLSPVRRIPVFIDADVVLCDSTVICEYLEDRHPSPPLLPEDPAERARARWIEEFADTRMGEVIIWRLFNERVIRRFVWGETTDEAVVRKALDEELPAVLDYLEAQVPAEGALFDTFGLADVSIAAFFRNASFAGVEIDASRWPRTAAFVARTLAHPGFTKLRPYEDLSARTPIPQWRDALRAAGAPISDETFAGADPRRGVMTI